MSPNQKLRKKIEEVRKLIDSKEIDSIELLYVHNCSESENVRIELETCSSYLSTSLHDDDIEITYKELGITSLEKLYIALSQQIIITENVKFEGDIIRSVTGDGWVSHVGFAKGSWLYNIFKQHGDDLFSANYRGFMGLNKRKKINSAIRNTAENAPNDFFVFNNGVSILTTKFNSEECILEGISIINGAQTTGSIGSVQELDKLQSLNVLCKVIECTDSEKVKRIVQFNNTQNHITTWDHYSNSPEQKAIAIEFKVFGYNYSLKRGFDNNNSSLFGIESVAQPLVALHGDYSSANRGKNYVFETKIAYENAFRDAKAQHILLAYTISKAIESVKSNLKLKTDRTANDEASVYFLQNLKSRFFLVAVIGEIFEEIVGKPVDKKLVKYKYDTSLSKNFDLSKLIELWTPVITAILPFIIKHTGQDLTSFLSKHDEPLKLVSDDVKSNLNSFKSLAPIPALSNLATHIE